MEKKNKSNIDIDQSILNLPTTQKAVANTIIKSGIANDTDGCRFIFMGAQVTAALRSELASRRAAHGLNSQDRTGLPKLHMHITLRIGQQAKTSLVLIL